jgi:hypothetical protein
MFLLDNEILFGVFGWKGVLSIGVSEIGSSKNVFSFNFVLDLSNTPF